MVSHVHITLLDNMDGIVVFIVLGGNLKHNEVG